MSMEFGKLNFSVSFNPTSAFPLDARSYFESYAEAEAAAKTAGVVGNTNSVYYYGQTLVVVEDNVAKFYIIQPNKTLSAIEGSSGETEVPVNSDLFEKDENGNLSLKGFDEATIGSFFVKGENGNLSWVKPIDAYTKDETDEKIRAAIADAVHIKRKIVDSISDIEDYMALNADAEQYIFMVPTGLTEDSDKYDEYMVIALTDDEGVTTKYIEKVGSWEVDLSQYAKTTDVNTALNTKVNKEENARLITNVEGAKLAGIEEGAQVNVVQSVEEMHFGLDSNKKLTLKDLEISKISGLQDALNGKINAKEGYELVSPFDREKLDALVIGDNGLEISGKVNAANVEGLAEWIANNANTTIGLSEQNFTSDFKEKLEAMLYISSVNKDQLSVNNGKLEIIAVDSTKITGLEEALNTRVSIEEFSNLEFKVDDLSDQFELCVKQAEYDKEIAKLWDTLTWKEIENI